MGCDVRSCILDLNIRVGFLLYSYSYICIRCYINGLVQFSTDHLSLILPPHLLYLLSRIYGITIKGDLFKV